MVEKMYLKLDGVQGESKNSGHVGEIEFYSFAWGTEKTQPLPLAGAVGVGRNRITDITIGKDADKTSPVLMYACATGRNFREAMVTMEKRSPSGSLLRSMIFKIKSVLVFSTSSDPTGQETITLNFEGLEMISI
jgi:type VI secretion system secreted protein Hcp